MKELSYGLTKGYMAYLEHFSIKIAGNMSAASMNGRRKSGAKGSSMEFSDFRQYVHGDDIRRIDWNSFARSGKLITKVFMEEKQAEINIFIDLSSSMAFYEEKGFYAKMIAASLSYVALKNNDNVNIYGWCEGLKEWKINSSSKNSFPQIVSFLDSLSFGGKTSLLNAVSSSLIKQSRGISVVISDFFMEDDMKSIIDGLRYRKQQVNLVQVLSSEEVSPELKGNLRFTDCETGEYRDVTVDDNIIESYKKALLDMQDNIHEYCKKSGASFSALNTKMPLEEALTFIL